jgi:GNAT superfamily N-acetyltransferase
MVVYRKLLPTELPDYCEHLLRLDPRDRRSRFLAPTEDRVIRGHIGRLDLPWTIIIGAFVDGVLRGAVELVGSPEEGMDRVELAVSVERAVQGTGAGTHLVRRAVLAARNRGIRYIKLICLLENRRMQAICRKMRGLLDYDADDVVCDIKVVPPTDMSVMEEAYLEGLAQGNMVLAYAPTRRTGTRTH